MNWKIVVSFVAMNHFVHTRTGRDVNGILPIASPIHCTNWLTLSRCSTFKLCQDLTHEMTISGLKNQNSHIFSTWSGLSFEMLCLNHEEEIKISLGISGISCNIFSWIGSNGQNVAQIDLLIDRSDNVINLCEMKYSSIPYRMSEKDEISIERKIDAFIQSTHTDKSIIVTMIAAKGLENNEYSGCIQKQLTLSDLFK